jgi:8-oxo-dGTP pyrophosphatase MutT (NUDIX family)
MKRQQILALLTQYTPVDACENEHWQNTITFIKQHDDCFERSLAVGHVTGSAWVIDSHRRQVLLMHHRKLNRWFQPGGHCDGESDVAQVALKEASEETGLTALKIVADRIFDIDVHLIPANAKEAAHYHYDIRFLVEADSSQLLVQNQESKNLAWINYEDVSNYNNDESMIRMARKVI